MLYSLGDFIFHGRSRTNDSGAVIADKQTIVVVYLYCKPISFRYFRCRGAASMPHFSLKAFLSVFSGHLKRKYTQQNGNIKRPTKGTSATPCPTCQDLSPDIEALNLLDFDAPKTKSELIDSANRGCAGRSVLVAVLAPYAAKCINGHTSDECTWRHRMEDDTLTVLLYCHLNHTSGRTRAHVRLYTLTGMLRHMHP